MADRLTVTAAGETAAVDFTTQRPLFGAFAGYSSATDHSEPYSSRLPRITALFGGRLGVERIYQGGNLALPAMASPAIVSWDFPVASTLAGQNDGAILAIAAGATKDLWLTPWHEVDNNKLSATDYVSVFRYVANRVHTIGNPLVKMTPIFMGFTVKGGVTTKFDQFYPGDAYVDAIGFDTYINPGIPAFNTPEGTLSAPLTIAAGHGKPLVIGEVSLYPGYTDAQWTDFTGRLITKLDTPAVDAVAWFETNKVESSGAAIDWRLATHASAVSKWAAVSSR